MSCFPEFAYGLFPDNAIVRGNNYVIPISGKRSAYLSLEVTCSMVNLPRAGDTYRFSTGENFKITSVHGTSILLGELDSKTVNQLPVTGSLEFVVGSGQGDTTIAYSSISSQYKGKLNPYLDLNGSIIALKLMGKSNTFATIPDVEETTIISVDLIDSYNAQVKVTEEDTLGISSDIVYPIVEFRLADGTIAELPFSYFAPITVYDNKIVKGIDTPCSVIDGGNAFSVYPLLPVDGGDSFGVFGGTIDGGLSGSIC